jgi:hypothetical protein
MLVFFCLFFTADDADSVPVGTLVTGIVGVTTAYIGLQVTNNGVIGKFYRPELDDRVRRGSENGDADADVDKMNKKEMR